jgi:ABC-type Mn2+/Zn2+ transport system ATPase subunit
MIDLALSILDLRFDYRNQSMLHHLSFSLERRTVYRLFGPNTSGKTTFFMVSGWRIRHANLVTGIGKVV